MEQLKDNQEDNIEDIVESELLSLDQGDVDESVSSVIDIATNVLEAKKYMKASAMSDDEDESEEDEESESEEPEESEESEESEDEEESEESDEKEDSDDEEDSDDDEEEEKLDEKAATTMDPVGSEDDDIDNDGDSDDADAYLANRRKKITQAVKKEKMKKEDTDINNIANLIESEEGLTEDFKAKAALIFEAEVTSRVNEVAETLKEEYETKLAEEVENINQSLTNQVDEYLTYAVEQWIKDNKVAIETSLRTSLAEDFMTSLKQVFVENYIEVPESKVDLFDKLEEETAQLKQDLAKANNAAQKLAEGVVTLTREKVLAEATKDLAETQAAKLYKLAENVEFDESFENKIDTLKKFYFSGQSEVITEDSNDDYEIVEEETKTIVEGADFEEESKPQISKQMQAYLQTLTRIQKSAK